MLREKINICRCFFDKWNVDSNRYECFNQFFYIQIYKIKGQLLGRIFLGRYLIDLTLRL